MAIPISFWGSPATSARLLQALLRDTRFQVCYVVTQPDKARSKRGQQILPSPVKKVSLENNIPVFTPHRLKQNKDLLAQIKQQPVDFHVVFAYGKIIPREFFEFPPLQAVNWHASLLPQLRGPAPIEYAFLNSHLETGWSLQKITERLDAGLVYAQWKIPINWYDTKESLTEKLIFDLEKKGPTYLWEYSQGILTPTPQKEAEATFSYKITPDMGHISWDAQAFSLRNLARALHPKPGIYIQTKQNKKLKLFLNFHVEQEKLPPAKLPPGHVQDIQPELLWVTCTDLCLPIAKLQWEGKKVLGIRDFLNGYPLKKGASLFL